MEEPFLQFSPVQRDSHKLELENQELMKNENKIEIYYEMWKSQRDHIAEDESLSRPRRELSTVDLFHDLFILASLVTVTARSEIIAAASLKAYTCFFTLIWFTWLQSVLFDIRFSTGSLSHYAHKAISCAVMTTFVMFAATYDIIHTESTVDGLKALSLVLMVSRVTLALQYAVALWCDADHERMKLPSLYTIGGLSISATAFLWMSLGLSSESEYPFGWYAVCAAEAVSMVWMSRKWKSDSVETTHLFDRLGMLTVILMAKGILALSRMTQRSFETLKWLAAADNFGELLCGILLMYFMLVLYFNHVKHDNIRSSYRPVWTVLHYPLHLAILVVVEGSSLLALSSTVNRISRAWVELHPLHDYPDWKTFFGGYLSPREVISDLSEDMGTLFETTFRNSTRLLNWYDYDQDIEEIKNIAHPFDSSQWQIEASETIDRLWIGTQRAILASFGIDGLAMPESDHAVPSMGEPAYQEHAMDAAFWSFYVAAGSLLLILALMSTPTVGKQIHKHKVWSSMVIKLTVGIAILIPVSPTWDQSERRDLLFFSPWTIAIVMFGYFTVITSDWLIYSSPCPERPNPSSNPPEYA